MVNWAREEKETAERIGWIYHRGHRDRSAEVTEKRKEKITQRRRDTQRLAEEEKGNQERRKGVGIRRGMGGGVNLRYGDESV